MQKGKSGHPIIDSNYSIYMKNFSANHVSSRKIKDMEGFSGGWGDRCSTVGNLGLVVEVALRVTWSSIILEACIHFTAHTRFPKNGHFQIFSGKIIFSGKNG